MVLTPKAINVSVEPPIQLAPPSVVFQKPPEREPK